MPKAARHYFLFAAALTFIGGLLHLAIIFGGPDWYRFFGAPEALAQMAATGALYPALVCVLIAGVLFTWTAYALSGAGLIKRLPFLRTILIAIALILIIRGIAFLPLMLLNPHLFHTITNTQSVDAFLLITSALCLVMGLAYAIAVKKSWLYLSTRA